MLNRLPCFSILAAAAAEEVTEAVGLEAAEPEEVAVGAEAEAEAEAVGVVEAVVAARPPPREGDGATPGGGNEEWQ